MVMRSLPFLLIACLALTWMTGETDADTSEEGIQLLEGEYYSFDLGDISQGASINFYLSADSDEGMVDGLLMTESQYTNWENGDGNGEHVYSGSTYGFDTWELYYYVVEESAHFYYVIDNSDFNLYGEEGSASVTVDAEITLDEYSLADFHTQLWLHEDEGKWFGLGEMNSGEIMDLEIRALSASVDCYILDENQYSNYESTGVLDYDRNATLFDTDWEMWNYQVLDDGDWYVYLFNSDESPGIHLDFTYEIHSSFDGLYSLYGDSIYESTRMIEQYEFWRIDLGDIESGDTIGIELSFENGDTGDDLDVLFMETVEADKYANGEDITVLGHPSLIGLEMSWRESWDYTFPDSGTYSIILDNTDSPAGGDPASRPIHLSIEVYKRDYSSSSFYTTHYVEAGNYISFDLGNLYVEDEIEISAASIDYYGRSSLGRFDVFILDNDNYNAYVDGTSYELMANSDFSDLDTFSAYRVGGVLENNGRYWAVVDTSDGPANGADSDGPWTFSIDISTPGDEVIFPQIRDDNYIMTARAASDDGTNESGNEDDGTNESGNEDDNSGNNPRDLTDAKPEDSADTSSVSLISVLLIIGIIALRRRY